MSLDDLSDKNVLRRSLIEHFSRPFAKDVARATELRKFCESDFERDVYDVLSEPWYWLQPQVLAGRFRIDMVVEGQNDTRLAIE